MSRAPLKNQFFALVQNYRLSKLDQCFLFRLIRSDDFHIHDFLIHLLIRSKMIVETLVDNRTFVFSSKKFSSRSLRLESNSISFSTVFLFDRTTPCTHLFLIFCSHLTRSLVVLPTLHNYLLRPPSHSTHPHQPVITKKQINENAE